MCCLSNILNSISLRVSALLLLILAATLLPVPNAEALVRFNNLECNAIDASWATVPICELKVPARGKIVLNIHVKLLQLPITSVYVNFGIYKRANGYHPFLYNMTVNVCDFLNNEKRSPVLKVIFDIVRNSTNLNHTCPYNHDVIVKDVFLADEQFKYLPLPNGDYLLISQVGPLNNWKLHFRIFMNFEWALYK